MEEVCLVAPLLNGKTEAARAFMGELDGARRDEYDASERRIGISKEVWFLAPTAAGELLVGYMESGEIDRLHAQHVTTLRLVGDRVTHLPQRVLLAQIHPLRSAQDPSRERDTHRPSMMRFPRLVVFGVDGWSEGDVAAILQTRADFLTSNAQAP
jgi:hypothetical protein